MKNILSETQETDLHARLLASVRFVKNEDIANKTILDMGCGYGWCIINFLSRNAKHITGIEHTEEAIRTARSTIQDSRVSFEISSATSLPFPNESFDTIVCWEVLEHIPPDTESKLYAEAYRVLKSGGTLYLSTPYNSLISKILDPAWWLIKHRHYSKKQMEQFGKNAGLTPTTLFTRGKLWDAFSTLNMYFAKWIFHRKPFFQTTLRKKTDPEYFQTGYIDIFAKYVKE